MRRLQRLRRRHLRKSSLTIIRGEFVLVNKFLIKSVFGNILTSHESLVPIFACCCIYPKTRQPFC